MCRLLLIRGGRRPIKNKQRSGLVETLESLLERHKRLRRSGGHHPLPDYDDAFCRADAPGSISAQPGGAPAGNAVCGYGHGRAQLPNVYAALFRAVFGGDVQSKGETIVKKLDNQSIAWRRGDLTVECRVNSFVIYKEISVTATRTIPMPVDLSFVKFPKEIPITVTSTAVVQNGDEFVRNIDLVADFVGYLKERYDLEFLDELANAMKSAADFLGI